MNKVIFGLILAVCVLGMALLMLNERLGRKPETAPVASAPQIITEKEIGLEPAPAANPGNMLPEAGEREMSEEMAAVAREYENREAREALAPPRVDDIQTAENGRIPPMPEPEEVIPPEPAPPAVKPEPKPAQQARRPEPAPKPAPKPEPAAKPEPKPAAQKPETVKPTAKQEEGTITRFVVFARDKGATIRLTGNRPMRYKTINLENPDRLVIDIEGDWKFPPRLEVPRNELVNSARVGKNGDKTRLVIDLKEKPRTSRLVPAKNGDSLDVRIDR